MLNGGAEMACMSTTTDLSIVASYSKSEPQRCSTTSRSTRPNPDPNPNPNPNPNQVGVAAPLPHQDRLADGDGGQHSVALDVPRRGGGYTSPNPTDHRSPSSSRCVRADPLTSCPCPSTQPSRSSSHRSPSSSRCSSRRSAARRASSSRSSRASRRKLRDDLEMASRSSSRSSRASRRSKCAGLFTAEERANEELRA